MTRSKRTAALSDKVGRLVADLPIVEVIRQSSVSTLRNDLVSAVTTAAMLIPQAMAYASLAELSPVTGLYAATVPLLLYAFFGRTPELAVGPVAMASLLVASGVSQFAEPGSQSYVDAAIQLALLVGLFQLILGVSRLGFLTTFISDPVMNGFTSATAVLIGLSQLEDALGIDIPRLSAIGTIRHAVENIEQTHLLTLGLTFGGFVTIVFFERTFSKVPSALIVILASIGLTWFFDLSQHGVAVVGDVPGGFPPLADPALLLPNHINAQLYPLAALIALISFLEAFAVAKHFGGDKDRAVEANSELVGVGLANIGSGVVSGFPISGALSRSAVQGAAGAKTNLAGVFTAAFSLITILFFTPIFQTLPQATLAAVVLSAVVGLFDVSHPIRLWRVNKTEFATLVVTFTAVIVLGIQTGILVGIAGSLVIFLLETTRPDVMVLGELPGEPAIYHNVTRHRQVRQKEHILVVRVDAPFYFANASYVLKELTRLEKERARETELDAVVIDASGINRLDTAGAKAFKQLLKRHTERGFTLYLANVKGNVFDVLEAEGFIDMLGREHLTLSVQDAVRRHTSQHDGRDAT